MREKPNAWAKRRRVFPVGSAQGERAILVDARKVCVSFRNWSRSSLLPPAARDGN